MHKRYTRYKMFMVTVFLYETKTHLQVKYKQKHKSNKVQINSK